MTLAQVVHGISTDTEFAARWRTNPEAALAEKGLQLSKEELAFLSAGLKKKDHDKVNIDDLLINSYRGWR